MFNGKLLFILIIMASSLVSSLSVDIPIPVNYTSVIQNLSINNSLLWDGHPFSYLTDNFVPYTGATSNVDLNTRNITATYFKGNGSLLTGISTANLTPYWLSNGSSTATGNWNLIKNNLSAYEINGTTIRGTSGIFSSNVQWTGSKNGILGGSQSGFFSDGTNYVYLADGTQSIYAYGDILTLTKFRSFLATGTAPLDIASTTKVGNLNVDYLDGYSSEGFCFANGTNVSGVNCINVSGLGGGWQPNNATENNNYNTTGNVSANKIEVLGSTGQFLAGTGTYAYSFAGDPDTGFGTQGVANYLAFIAGGSTRMVISTSSISFPSGVPIASFDVSTSNPAGNVWRGYKRRGSGYPLLGQEIVSLEGQTWTGTGGTNTIVGNIVLVSSEDHTATSRATKWEFRTTNSTKNISDTKWTMDANLVGGGNISAFSYIANGNAGYTGTCINTTFIGGIAVSCND